MKLERSKVDFPLWRKKVDKSIFEHNGTTIPVWACEMWGLAELFSEVSSRRDPKSKIRVEFNNHSYDGWVTTAKHGRSSPAYRLWYEESLSIELKRAFPMSYMRALESNLSTEPLAKVEKQIPFWEFLDIEFDCNSSLFKFVAYFTQEPSFPELFSRLIGSPAVARIDDEFRGKKGYRIHKQDWKPRSELEYEVGATNVVYMLADTKRKLLYIGEAKDLIKRLSQRYPTIPHWDQFRYDVLPEHLESIRVPIERMMIRAFASLLDNKKDILSLSISKYKLANDKIDK